jgi:hypothetical protein
MRAGLGPLPQRPGVDKQVIREYVYGLVAVSNASSLNPRQL